MVTLALWMLLVTEKTEPQSAAIVELQTILERATKNPSDQKAVDALYLALPKAGNDVVFEGDIRLNRSELVEYLLMNAADRHVNRLRTAAGGIGEKVFGQNRELKIDKSWGRDNYLRNRAQRSLSYAVDASSFPERDHYMKVVKNFAVAAKEWSELCAQCGITFTHRPELDDQRPSPKDGVSFVVRRLDANGAFIASAFFPGDRADKRYVEVDPSYFSSPFDPVGVFRHEIGHIMGYRHEHIEGVKGCAREGKGWRPLTPYDPKSVMHYFCGDGGGLPLSFSGFDKEGHARLYRLD